MIKLHNTLSRKTEQFRPTNLDSVLLYTCGPTVYDYAHIGNLRSFVFDDTLRRALEAHDYSVKHVMNITDVGHLVSDEDEGDDKLEKGAQRDNKTVREIADFYTSAFLADVKDLNILQPNGYRGPAGNYARATDFIDEQLELVKLLSDKSYAYVTTQAIYFDVAKLDDYGKLTGQKLVDKEVGARADVVTDDAKRNPQDFALWFFRVGRFASHSLFWPSPWGDGFPGWHLECSAIIHATLGEPLDIHTGGVDHIGTHHTNEIAQTEAAYGVELAKFWVHNEHLLVDGERMAKSKNNYYRLTDVTAKSFSPLALRLLFLQAHYRSQMNFTWESLAGAQAFLKRLQMWADLSFQEPAEIKNGSLADVKQAVYDDLNTPAALALLADIAGQKAPEKAVLKELDQLFGLDLSKRSDIAQPAKNLIEEREATRRAGDWQKSDSLRDQLLSDGIELNDTPGGTRWHKL
jgi:cysteinyl-tRNA synthetase